MGKNAYGYNDNSDLWGINPQTGKPYTVRDRRDSLRTRDGGMGMIQNVLPDPQWDDWFDRVAQASYAMTGKTQNQLKTSFEGGPSPDGSNQLRGETFQPPENSLWELRNAINGNGSFSPTTVAPHPFGTGGQGPRPWPTSMAELAAQAMTPGQRAAISGKGKVAR